MAYLTVFMSLIFIGVVPQLAYKYLILDELPFITTILIMIFY